VKRRLAILALLAAALLAAATPGPARALGGPQPVVVSVEGEVRRPGPYTLPPGSTLSALLLAAGGFTDNAFLRGAILTRASARVAQKAELEQMIAGVSQDNAVTAEAREAVRPVIDLLAALRPSGRVPVRLSHPRLLKGSPADIPLENGDILRVPLKTDTVTVAGAVPSAPRAIPFKGKTPYKEYIRQAGGYADGADRNNVYVLRADGTVALLSLGFISWNPAASRWEVTALAGGYPAVDSGDTIVVPRPAPSGIPSKVAREIPGLVMRAAEIAVVPVVLP